LFRGEGRYFFEGTRGCRFRKAWAGSSSSRSRLRSRPRRAGRVRRGCGARRGRARRARRRGRSRCRRRVGVIRRRPPKARLIISPLTNFFVKPIHVILY